MRGMHLFCHLCHAAVGKAHQHTWQGRKRNFQIENHYCSIRLRMDYYNFLIKIPVFKYIKKQRKWHFISQKVTLLFRFYISEAEHTWPNIDSNSTHMKKKKTIFLTVQKTRGSHWQLLKLVTYQQRAESGGHSTGWTGWSSQHCHQIPASSIIIVQKEERRSKLYFAKTTQCKEKSTIKNLIFNQYKVHQSSKLRGNFSLFCTLQFSFFPAGFLLCILPAHMTVCLWYLPDCMRVSLAFSL